MSTAILDYIMRAFSSSTRMSTRARAQYTPAYPPTAITWMHALTHRRFFRVSDLAYARWTWFTKPLYATTYLYVPDVAHGIGFYVPDVAYAPTASTHGPTLTRCRIFRVSDLAYARCTWFTKPLFAYTYLYAPDIAYCIGFYVPDVAYA